MMRLLASFVMRGRSQAVMAATILAVLSLTLAPLGILSAAVVGLVTLREGPRPGIFVAFMATAACGLLAILTVGNMAPALGFLALLWLPAWFLGAVLRTTRSLALAVQGALFLGLALIVVYYLQFPDPVAEWTRLLEPFSQTFVDSKLIEASQREELVQGMARWMTGIFAAVYYLQLVAALLFARWWQAMLYNPGGFRQEFHRLSMQRWVAYLGLLILALAFTADDGLMVKYVAVLLMAAYFIQGLAVIHASVAKSGSNPGWLIAMYVLLLLAAPYMIPVLVIAGFADGLFDFRARMRSKGDDA